MEEVSINPNIEPSDLTQDWGNRLLEGTNKSLCTVGPRRREQWPHKRLTQPFLWVSRSLWHKRRLHSWTSPYSQYWNQIDYFLCSQRWRFIQSAKTRRGADCGSNYELLTAKLRLKLKRVGKSNGPFRYDLNQILYDYTVEVTNRFKGLDPIECMRTTDGSLWHCTRGSDQDHPQEKEMQKGKMVVWGSLTNSCENKKSERQRIKGKIYPSECRVPKNIKQR